MQHLTGRYNY